MMTSWLIPATVLAAAPDSTSVRVVIDNIRHQGGDEYSLQVVTSHASTMGLLVSIIEDGFFIQTDKGWNRIPLHQDRLDEEFLVPAGKTHERMAHITISPATPHLFRTFEGDLSLAYRYTYKVRRADKTAVLVSDEVYCWVRPGTSQWILREGM